MIQKFANASQDACAEPDFRGGAPLIDMVYLWVDGNSPELKEKRLFWQKKYGQKIDSQATEVCRFINNDELKYSLRSVEKFAPWINNIFIVTDNQIPEWLNCSHPKIHIIDHSQILPQDALPTFNAPAIETGLHKIPKLSEYFLFANDDMLFANPTESSFFFNEKNQVIVRTRGVITQEKIESHSYFFNIRYSYDLFNEKFGTNFVEEPHHSIDAYKKSDIEECIKLFQEEFDKTAKNKFRQKYDVSRAIYSAYSCYTGSAILKSVDKEHLSLIQKLFKTFANSFKLDSMCFGLHSKNIMKNIKKYKPNVICLNDDGNSNEKDRQKLRKILPKLFPEKSEFEI